MLHSNMNLPSVSNILRSRKLSDFSTKILYEFISRNLWVVLFNNLLFYYSYKFIRRLFLKKINIKVVFAIVVAVRDSWLSIRKKNWK